MSRSDNLGRVQTDFRYTRSSVPAVQMVLNATNATRRVVLALRDGAASARDYAGELTYADGWAMAATLAELTAFESIAPVE